MNRGSWWMGAIIHRSCSHIGTERLNRDAIFLIKVVRILHSNKHSRQQCIVTPMPDPFYHQKFINYAGWTHLIFTNSWVNIITNDVIAFFHNNLKSTVYASELTAVIMFQIFLFQRPFLCLHQRNFCLLSSSSWIYDFFILLAWNITI